MRISAGVFARARADRAERRPRERLVREIGDEGSVVLRENGETHAIHRETLAARERIGIARADAHARSVHASLEGLDRAGVKDDSGKHSTTRDTR